MAKLLGSRKPVIHHFTVDVEEYFQVLALEPYIARSEWDSIPGRLEIGLRVLLDLMSEHETRGTFLALGAAG